MIEQDDFLQIEAQLEKEERWENLTIANDFIFAKAMRDPEICREVLEVLLEVRIEKISYPEEQKVIDIVADSKSVRLDVYLEGEDAVYNIEMQAAKKRSLPKRSRYYSSMIDLNAIEKGADYSELPKSFIIFICTFDPFGKEHRRYTFQNVCGEVLSLPLNDGVTKIFFNTKGVNGNLSAAAKNFLNFIESGEAGDNFTRRLKEKVDRIKENKKWRVEYMTLMMREREKYKDGYRNGFDDGVAQERATWEEKESAWTLEREEFLKEIEDLKRNQHSNNPPTNK